jgi:magnesium-transporting ATPase (P-type)
MDIATTIQITGFVLAAIPTTAFVMVNIAMIKGVGGEDDPMVMSLAMAGLTLFLIGTALLVITYLTNLLQNNLDQSVSTPLVSVLRVVGWFMAVPPPVILVSVSVGLAYKMGQKDKVFRMITVIGLTSFLIGVGLLLIGMIWL